MDRTFIPLLEKAQTFGNREAALKLEEQYWYQTACLLEERRELSLRKRRRPHPAQASQPTSSRDALPPRSHDALAFGSERELVHGNATSTGEKLLFPIAVGIAALLGGLWAVWYGLP